MDGRKDRAMSEMEERWPGYDEQSWAERFWEMCRKHDGLLRSFNALHEEAIKALAEKRDRIEQLERELAAVVAAERERCASIVDERAEACRMAGVREVIDPLEAQLLDEHLSEAAAAIRTGEAEQ